MTCGRARISAQSAVNRYGSRLTIMRRVAGCQGWTTSISSRCGCLSGVKLLYLSADGAISVTRQPDRARCCPSPVIREYVRLLLYDPEASITIFIQFPLLSQPECQPGVTTYNA